MLTSSYLSLPSGLSEWGIGVGNWMLGHNIVFLAHRFVNSPLKINYWVSELRHLCVGMVGSACSGEQGNLFGSVDMVLCTETAEGSQVT